VFDILVRSDNTVWIGNQAGVAVYPDLNTTTRSEGFNELNGLSNPKVRRILEYDGRLWIATWGGGVSVYDIAGDSWTALRASGQGLINDQVADIAQHNGLLFFATNGGVSIHDPVSGTWQRFRTSDGLMVPFVSSVEVITSTGGEEQRWYGPRVEFGLDPSDLGTVGVTLDRPARGVSNFTVVNSGLIEPNVNDIFYDADDDVTYLCLTTSGIARVDLNTSSWTYVSRKDGLPSDNTYSITKVGGVLWVATQNGIARELSDGSWQGYNRSGGLKADRVRRVYTDDPSRLWLGYIQSGAGRVAP
jgi:ligand-binding sensor domain-containing protein